MVQEILEQAMEEGRKEIVHGETASYIPELGNVDKNHLGICIYTAGGEVFSAGDTDVRFTIQSISKVISLAAALEAVLIRFSQKWVWSRRVMLSIRW